jgi:CheY-like chemotaxis protein
MKSLHPPAAEKTVKILLIDDNRNGLLARKKVLEEQGFCITIASSPEDGLHQFLNGTFDLVVTDYRMPHMNGKQVIDEIRKVRPATPVVLISGMVDPLGLNEENTGADAVVAKSNNEVSHLVRAVNRLLRKPARKPPSSQGPRSSSSSKRRSGA